MCRPSLFRFNLQTKRKGWQNMPKITQSDLKYKDYSWTAIPGDNPEKVLADADRVSRHEGYEVIYFLNSLTGKGNADLSIKTRQICEWMIHEKLPSNIQGRAKIRSWIANNFAELSKSYPF